MNMKGGLTFACMNLKKLAKIPEIRERQENKPRLFFIFLQKIKKFTFLEKEW